MAYRVAFLGGSDRKTAVEDDALGSVESAIVTISTIFWAFVTEI